MEQVISQSGLPLALYTDRHAVFQPVGQCIELPGATTRLGVSAAEPAGAWRAIEPHLDIASVLGFRLTRLVARDNVVKHGWRTLTFLPGTERTSSTEARGSRPWIGPMASLRSTLGVSRSPPNWHRHERAGCGNRERRWSSVPHWNASPRGAVPAERSCARS